MAMVAVFGARGRQGLAQLGRLIEAGHRPLAISRDPAALAATPYAGVQIASADFEDAASLVEACRQAEVVFFNRPLVSLSDPVAQARRLGEAAAEAGVRQVIFNTSLFVSDAPCGDPATDTALAMENALAETAPGLTVFRPVLFMDNLLTNWARPFIVHEGRYVYAHNPSLEADWISLDDVARFMVAAIGRSDLAGERLVIGGPERLTPPKVAAILSEALGRPVRYDPSTPEAFGERLVAAFGDQVPEPMQGRFAERIAGYYHFANSSDLRPFCVDMAPILARIPVRMETMADWARRQDWSDGAGPRPPAG